MLSTPTCGSRDIAASLGPQNGAAGTIHSTIALVNISKRRCTLPAFPALSFTAQNDVIRVAVRRVGKPSSVSLAPRRAAEFTIAWSDADTASGACEPSVDVTIGLPGAGMPLWVPLQASACRAMLQSALVARAGHIALPSGAAAAKFYQRWLQAQDCEAARLWLATHAHFSKPAHPDTLAIDLSHGTNFNTSGFVGQGFAAPQIAFDPSQGLLAESLPGNGVETILCGGVHSIPYGIARMKLPARTARGIRIGMPMTQAKKLAGNAPLRDAGGKQTGLQYRWSAEGTEHTLTIIGYAGRVAAIDYSERPR